MKRSCYREKGYSPKARVLYLDASAFPGQSRGEVPPISFLKG